MLGTPNGSTTTLTLGERSFKLLTDPDLPGQWLKAAIRGLENMTPFTIAAQAFGDRILITVSFRCCHLICEKLDGEPTDQPYKRLEMTMPEFCTILCRDISDSMDAWLAVSPEYLVGPEAEHRAFLEKLLERLEGDIARRERFFRLP